MEAAFVKENGAVVVKVETGSIAEELEIKPGDRLLSVNGTKVTDVFDYRYLMQEEIVVLMFQASNGEFYEAEIEKEMEEDIGLIFESGLMDHAKSCVNKCIFCFIDQLPPGMRDTLYFKDDDSRLSFLQGNYVTLTNMRQEDIARILYYHLSPIHISVHTTDSELRKKMLHNKNAGNVLERMKQFAEAGITMNLQVVLCKNINDKAALDKTISDCAEFFPHAKSLSVVPVGRTKYRDNLYPLEAFGKADAEEVICQIEAWQKKLKEKLGSSFVFAADEFYLKAEKEFPPYEAYEDFPQYENGVGMIAALEQEFDCYIKNMKPDENITGTCSMATGMAASGLFKSFADRMKTVFPNLKIQVFPIFNTFFGEEITVSGLLTGRDIIAQLKGKPLGRRLILPDSLLRNGESVLLDNIWASDLEKALAVPVRFAKNSAESIIHAVKDTEDMI